MNVSGNIAVAQGLFEVLARRSSAHPDIKFGVRRRGGYIPEFRFRFAAQFFGGTSLLIVVGVVLDTMRQIETHLLQRHYDGFLRKGKLRGRFDRAPEQRSALASRSDSGPRP